MMSISMPEQIKSLERQIGVPLHPLRGFDVTDSWHRTCYQLDEDGQIIGLNLALCRITDGSFLKGLHRLTKLSLDSNNISDNSFLTDMPKLASLSLSSNNISDGSFLKGMPQLTSLELSSNKVSNWSFLKNMNQLTKLSINSNNISDGSFLQGMDQLTTLNLGSNNITDGSFLRGLNKLTNLALNSSKLSDWSFLKGINQLGKLALNCNKISDWSFLRGMGQLTHLDLSSNNITDGSFLKGMNQLTHLSLSDNKITDWSFLNGMNQLTSLYLDSNNITDGSFLKRMNRLNILFLGSNNITDWSFLREMTSVTFLYLNFNNITDGSFLKGMNQLTSLYLGSNKISDGSFLKEMCQLTVLDLSSNKISDWSFFRGMRELTHLYLRSNNITEWSLFRGMNRLTVLDLSHNKLEKIPPDFIDNDLEIRNDQQGITPYSINVYGNPLKEPPIEIVEQGNAAILTWYRASQEGEIDINEVKIILVGDGGSGKTTVRKRLTGLPGDPNESQTHGIEIHDYEVPCQGRSILAHFWDFGGQEIMHATHQFFLSRRSLYILLLDGRKEEDVDYWLKHIESFGGDSPILICLNKIDQNPSFEVDRKNLRERYHGIQDFYRLKCLEKGDTEVNRLIKDLPQYIEKVEMLQNKWPRKWAKVKGRLLGDNKPFIDQGEFVRICNEEKIEEQRQQHTLIRFLNDLGVALHFDDQRLSLLQILNPRWATQAVYRIINDPETARTRGILSLDRLSTILGKVKPEHFEYPRDKLNYIVDLMKRFELCHELTSNSVLLPDLLTVEEPRFIFSKQGILRFRFQYDYLPASILPRMIVQMHSDTDGDLRWRSGIVLKMKGGRARALIRSDRHDKRISIEVEGTARKNYFAAIRDRFDKIHSGFQKLTVKEQIPLPDHPELVVEYSDLLFHEEKKRKTVLVGAILKEYSVENLLNGIEPKEVRQARKRSNESDNLPYNDNYVKGEKIGDIFHFTIAGVSGSTIIIGKGINHVIAEKIENSFNKAGSALDRTQDIRDLLQLLAQEVANIIEKLPNEKAEETADDLETLTEESIKEKPAKKYWNLSKKGIIEAAQSVGIVGKTAIELVTKLGQLLGWT